MQSSRRDWFDGALLDGSGPSLRTDEEWTRWLVSVWGDRYEQRFASASLVLVTQAGATYVLDVDLEHGWSRTVVAVARLRAAERPRDRSYQAGFPLTAPLERALDRGHLIPSSGAGEYGPNLFPQDAALNRGRSFEGRRFRAMERLAVRSGALYFCALDYCDGSEIPAVVTAGVLSTPGGWTVDVYRNRFDPAARAAFPDATRPTDLDLVLRDASTAAVGDLGEEVARSYLEHELGLLIVDLDDALMPRRDARHGVDIVAVEEGELVAVEVKTRLRSKRRRTPSGDLARPRLGRTVDGRQASQQYVLQRLTDVIDVGPDTAVSVRVIVVDLHDMLIQQFVVDDNGRAGRTLGPPEQIRAHAETALDVVLERIDG